MRFAARLFCLAAIIAGASAAAAQTPASNYDVVIAGGRVIDPESRLDAVRWIGIRNGSITAISEQPLTGRLQLDARGHVVAPGFIDLHAHGQDAANYRLFALDGVTTALEMEIGTEDVAGWYAQREGRALINYGVTVGHPRVRMQLYHDQGDLVPSGAGAHTKATPAQIAELRALIRRGLEQGALGVGFGLQYTPAASRWEVLEMFREAAAGRAPVFVHVRAFGPKEPGGSVESFLEVISAATITNAPLHIVHLNSMSLGETPKTLQIVREARARGLDVTTEAYPYSAGLTEIKSALLDQFENQPDSVLAQLQWPVTGERLNRESFRRYRAQGGVVVLHLNTPEMEAMAIADSLTAIASDGGLRDGIGHPRSAGTYARVLGHYVRERKALSLMEALRKMTLLPAQRLEARAPAFRNKGRIRVGADADIAVFDPATVIDRSTYAQPGIPAVGFRHVLVNGVAVVRDGRLVDGVAPGKAARAPQQAAGSTRGRNITALEIDRIVLAEMTRQKIPGVAVAVVSNGDVVHAQGYGFANVEHQVPVTRETIFQSGSVGKQFTAAAAMLLVEAGKLGLDDPLTKYLPAAPPAWRDIKVRHLLTHTSGIPDYTTDAMNYWRDYTEAELAQLAFTLEPEFPAGARWNYSNTGYVLLGIIVGKAADKFYGDVLSERLFRPLGMNTARVITEADVVPNRAAGYVLGRNGLRNQSWVAPTLNTTADGSLYITLNDMIAWDRGLRGGAILKPESWRAIYAPVRLNSGSAYPYGFGWSIDTVANQTVHQHGGAWQGFKAHIGRYLGDDLSVIVLANLAQADQGLIANRVASLFNPALKAAELAPIADTEPAVTRRLYEILAAVKEKRIQPADFAYLRAGFFPGAADHYAEMLAPLNEAPKATLLRRSVLGDDVIRTYDVAFGATTLRVTLGTAPDGKISQFGMQRR